MEDLTCTRKEGRHPAWIGTAVAVMVIAVLSAATLAATGQSRYAAFAVENAKAMAKMMSAMDVKPSGDVDADFAAMMIAHHEGAVDMAMAELRYGGNEKLRRIAQAIVVSQPQEIAAMRVSLGQPPGLEEPARADAHQDRRR